MSFNETITRGASVSNSGLSAQQINDVERMIELASDLWGSYIDAPGATIDIIWHVEELSGNTVAQAKALHLVPIGSGIFRQGTIEELRTGNDPNGSTPDIEITVDLSRLQNGSLFAIPDVLSAADPALLSSQDFDTELGTDVDLLTVLTHEIGHGLGFNVFSSGSNQTIFQSLQTLNGGSWQFNGANAVSVYGSSVPIANGSRAHLGFADLMNPTVDPGVRETLSAVDIAILNDLGVPIIAATENNDRLYGFFGFNDTINGLDGADLIWGLSGRDTLSGGGGNDVIFGGDGDDMVFGDAGNDSLRGGSGNDTLNGGSGDQDYAVYQGRGETLGELLSYGVRASLTSGSADHGNGTDTLINIENLSGSNYDDELTGDNGDNFIFGNQGDDVLIGHDGDDWLHGGDGIDWVDYSYIPQPTGVVLAGVEINLDAAPGFPEGAVWRDGQGWVGEDRIDEVENIIGSNYLDRLTGDGGANHIMGLEGFDFIYGGGGDDTLEGGSGNDTIDGGPGSDVVDGNEGDDRIHGGSGFGNDIINGGDGTDIITYINATPLGPTNFGVDVDLATSSSRIASDGFLGFSWVDQDTLLLFENVEGSAYDDLLSGDSGANLLLGSSGEDTLSGRDGDDTLNGGGQAGDVDNIDGGDGNDWVSYANSTPVGAGDFAVQVDLAAGRSFYGSNDINGVNWIDEDFLTGIENVEGSQFSDILLGDASDNMLRGLGGDDELDGRGGTDTAVFRRASTDYSFAVNGGVVTVTDNTGLDGTDTLIDVEFMQFTDGIFSTANAPPSLSVNSTLSEMEENLDVGSGIHVGDIEVSDDLFGSYTLTLSGDDSGAFEIRNDSELFYVGTSPDYEVQQSYTVDVTVDDPSIGGTPDASQQFVLQVGDVPESITGTAADEVLNGDIGQDRIFGLGGNDQLFGKDDNDTLDGGDGNDLLDGGPGGDIMIGGDGNDRFVFNNAGDRVIETSAITGGFDSVLSLQTVNLTDATIFQGRIEAATLFGSANANAIGNIVANVLTGNDGMNVINGLGGADTMRGRGGSDTYVIDNVGDIVDETLPGSSGFDRVLSSVTVNFSNTAQIRGALERIELTGSANINGTGNLLANSIVGNSGNNILNGLNGNDVLTGGAGNDAFFFSFALGGGNVDTITDYNVINDRLWLDDAVFTSLNPGPLPGTQLRVFGTGPQDANDFLLYDQANGRIFYDADANGAGTAQIFAVVTPGTALNSGDFLVV